MATRTLLTVEQFDQLTATEGVKYELDEGELVTVTSPRPRHGIVRDRLAKHLMIFVDERALGKVFIEMDFQLAADTIRIPDIAFVPAGRMKQLDLDRRIEGAPVLAIEVVSPSDLAEELARKVEQYLAAGCQAVWVLYPKAREAHLCHANGVAILRGDQDVLENQELLPGFTLPWAIVFE